MLPNEVPHHVAALFQTHGQAIMEPALAAWYLKKAHTAPSSELRDDAIKKAQALDPEGISIYLAESHRRKNQFCQAAQYYLMAFEANPKLRSRWTYFGDFLLRYGSPREVLGFFGKVGAIDGDDAKARFVLECYDYFETLKEEIHASLTHSGQDHIEKIRIIMQLVCWGARYTELFLNYLLPALCAPGNLPSLSHGHDADFILFTDGQGGLSLRQHPLFNELKKHCRPHVITLPKRLIEYAAAVSKLPNGPGAMPATLLTNAAHYAGLELGRQLQCHVLNLCPDHILSNRFMQEMAIALTGNPEALTGPGFRIYYTQNLINELRTKYIKPGGTLEIPPREMVNLLHRYLPEPNFVHASNFSNYPIYLCWRVDDQGILAHINHYHPWVVSGTDLNGPVELSLDPIDGNFLHRALCHKNRIAFAPLGMLSFDLGENPLCQPTENNRFEVQKVAQWVRPFLTPVHERYFENALIYKEDENISSSEWQATIQQARRDVEEIIHLAKQM